MDTNLTSSGRVTRRGRGSPTARAWPRAAVPVFVSMTAP